MADIQEESQGGELDAAENIEDGIEEEVQVGQPEADDDLQRTPDRVVESPMGEPPEIDDYLFNVMVAALNEAKEKMEAGEGVEPFTALGVKDKLFIEHHDGVDSDQLFAEARHTVQNASGAGAYALCYDGYVDTDEGVKDVIIAEGGVPGQDMGYAIGYLYEEPSEEGKAPTVTAEPVYIGQAPNFMAFTRPIEFDEEEAGEEAANGEAAEEEPEEQAEAKAEEEAEEAAEAESEEEAARQAEEEAEDLEEAAEEVAEEEVENAEEAEADAGTR